MNTPTQADIERARKIATDRMSGLDIGDSRYNGLIGDVADALAAARAEGERAGLEQAKRLTCRLCTHDVEYFDGMHQYPHTGEWVNCKAIAIHRELRSYTDVQMGETK